MQDDVRIRRATLVDAPRVARIHVETGRIALRDLVPVSLLDAISVERRVARWSDRITSLDPNARTWVAERSGEVVGFCHVRGCHNDDGEPDAGHLQAIYVDPSVAGMGIGQSLLEIAIDTLDDLGFDEATLWVLDENIAARQFYENAGWAPDGGQRLETVDGTHFKEIRYRYRIAVHA